MGSLRIEASGVNDKGVAWRDVIGSIDTIRNVELALEKVKKNYAKGTVLTLWEKKDNRLENHMQVEGTATEDKAKSHEKCMIQAKVADGQMDIKELNGEDADLLQFKIASFNNKKDAWEALQGIATETPKNTILELLVLDDNNHWKIEKQKQGVMRVSIGGQNADDAPDTKPDTKVKLRALN